MSRKYTRREILEWLKAQGVKRFCDLKAECREMEKFLPVLKEVRHGA